MLQLLYFQKFGNMEATSITGTHRRTLSPRLAYALAAATIGLALFASATPSPLYETYGRLWGLSPVVLTLVYATYAVAVLTTLILAGRVSDEIGRRPVLLAALTGLILATVLFMLASSVIWLFFARALQGIATGAALSAASAALLDLRRDPTAVGLTNGVASAGGLGLGAVVAATLVEFAPAPRVVPYLVLFVLFALTAAATLAMPESVERRSRLRLTPQMPRVPASVRGPFVLAALAVISSWSIGGLFLALGPQLSTQIFDSTNHLVSGIGIFALTGSGAVSQLAFGRTSPWLGATAGSIALAAGTLLIVGAASSDSAALFLAGGLIGGAGFGVAFLGALRALSVAIPNEHRAEVMSAFYVVAYASLSVPAIVAGVLVRPIGLEETFELFGTLVAALALVVAVGAWRTRPQAEPVGARAIA
jgi:predicted MFS family arabinose efflux permease